MDNSADPCSYARVSRLDNSVSLDTGLDEMDDSIGSWRERQNSHRAHLGCRAEARHKSSVRPSPERRPRPKDAMPSV